jgi:hypothetical protein
MFDKEREKELEGLIDEYKRDLKALEKVFRQNGLPSNLEPVIREQIEHRLIGKTLRNILYRDDDKEAFEDRAKNIRCFYDSLMKHGFDHDTALTIICNTHDPEAAMLLGKGGDAEEDD